MSNEKAKARSQAKDDIDSIEAELSKLEESCKEYSDLIKSTKDEVRMYESDLEEEKEKLAEVNDRYDMAQEVLVNAI